MAAAPDNLLLAAGHVPVGADDAWSVINDLARWPELFGDWLAEVRDDDDRMHAVGTGGERYDLYPHPAEDSRGIDVEVVDELGGADVLRLRLIDARGGGCFVVIAGGRLPGISDTQWERVRGAIAGGVDNLPTLMA